MQDLRKDRLAIENTRHLVNGHILPTAFFQQTVKVEALIGAYRRLAKGFYFKNVEPTGELPSC